MASAIYPKAKEALWKGDLDVEAATMKCVMLDTADYTYSSAHDFLDDVPAAARVGTPQTLGSKTFTNGVFDAADVTFPTVSGDSIEAILIYEDTGVESTSHVVIYIDGVSFTPASNNCLVQWHSSGIAAL